VSSFHTICYSDGWDSAPEGGDVLLGVEKQQLERLHQQHLVQEDYLQMVSSVSGHCCLCQAVLFKKYCSWCGVGLAGCRVSRQYKGDGRSTIVLYAAAPADCDVLAMLRFHE
jgi:hypothetical protein